MVAPTDGGVPLRPLAADAVTGGDARLTTVELNRLRWRCRRGMLENDLILERYLAARGDMLTNSQVAALDQLLALADDALWDLLSGRAEAADPAVAQVLAALRSA
jgi:succinate dehydrogenase flavin-adding protein (antitoxin of CptAB toxin-antitoxin module)